MRTNSLRLIAVVLLFAIIRLSTAEPSAAVLLEKPSGHDARMVWWREARFGLFIHWGLYTLPAGTWHDEPAPGLGDWIMQRAKIPVQDYAALAGQFQPAKFNADAWVALAKGAGVKYLVVAAKHHDGFAMFRSKVSPFNIHDATPFKRDPLKELAAACKKQELKLGFYYSQEQDWHHAGGSASGGHWDKAQDGERKDYLHKIAVPQVKELVANYGPVAGLWWDGPQDLTAEDAALFRTALQRQPRVICANWLGGDGKGDIGMADSAMPATGRPGTDCEMRATMNDTRGYKATDNNWKPASVLLCQLIDTVSKGGNYLLNVGPNADGEFPAASIERLSMIGAWLKTNGEAIYGTTASPFERLDFGRATQKPGRIYLHVFNWPHDGSLAVPLGGTIKKAYLLSAPKQELAVTTGKVGAFIKVPATPPDPMVNVVALEIDGKPEVLAVPSMLLPGMNVQTVPPAKPGAP